MAKEYIEREADLNAVDNAISMLSEQLGGTEIGNKCVGLVQIVRDFAAKLPAADVAEVKHGRWEYTPIYAEFCSVCGGYPDDNANHHYDYCPHCGAKMDLEDNDNPELIGGTE